MSADLVLVLALMLPLSPFGVCVIFAIRLALFFLCRHIVICL